VDQLEAKDYKEEISSRISRCSSLSECPLRDGRIDSLIGSYC
jgi:hypothetical protein